MQSASRLGVRNGKLERVDELRTNRDCHGEEAHNVSERSRFCRMIDMRVASVARGDLTHLYLRKSRDAFSGQVLGVIFKGFSHNSRGPAPVPVPAPVVTLKLYVGVGGQC